MSPLKPAIGLMSLLVVFLVNPIDLAATSAEVWTGSSGPRNASEVGSESWRFSTPDATASIEWKHGRIVINGSIINTGASIRTENKFGPGIVGRLFDGFRLDFGGGPPFSGVSLSGEGSSSKVASLWGHNYYANWALDIWGHIGTMPTGVYHGYMAISEAKDPWPITPATFEEAEITEDAFDYFMGVGIVSGETEHGGLGLQVFYDVANDTTLLLDISVLADTLTVVTNDAPPGLRFYLLSGPDEGPTEIGENLIDLATVQTLLEEDQEDFIIEPLNLGLLWEDIPVPTEDLGDGSVARIRVESSIFHEEGDTGTAVPEFVSPDVLLHQNMPNPFNPSTTIGFDLKQPLAVDLRIFDTTGRLVRVLANREVFPSGYGSVVWNGRDDSGQRVPSGLYLYRIETENHVVTKRMMQIK